MKPGTVIGDRFELLARAGQGGMGSVYRARDRATGGEVAVKLVPVEKPADRLRFDREASLLAHVRHPNVVDYLAHGSTSEDVQFLAQEWVDGTTLSAHLGSAGTTAREAVAIALGVADALGAIHAEGIIHRDIKPSNIIIADGRPDHIKLVDFGVARFADRRGAVTRTGGVVGTPSYMAPEQARGLRDLTPAADVWALGCVLYECLTGWTAFAGGTPIAIRTKVVLSEPPSVASLCGEAPAPLVELVQRMLSKPADRRPANGREVADALRALSPIADGPRRRVGAEPPTLVVPELAGDRVEDGPTCFVMFSVVGKSAVADAQGELAVIAARHAVDLELLDEGAAVLRARERGKVGALEAARAAMGLREQLPHGAICVFARASGQTIEDALERGATMLQRATIERAFGKGIGGVPPEAVRLDDAIADLLAGALAVTRTKAGPILEAARA